MQFFEIGGDESLIQLSQNPCPNGRFPQLPEKQRTRPNSQKSPKRLAVQNVPPAGQIGTLMDKYAR
jgi:hypothetical protein